MPSMSETCLVLVKCCADEISLEVILTSCRPGMTGLNAIILLKGIDKGQVVEGRRSVDILTLRPAFAVVIVCYLSAGPSITMIT